MTTSWLPLPAGREGGAPGPERKLKAIIDPSCEKAGVAARVTRLEKPLVATAEAPGTVSSALGLAGA